MAVIAYNVLTALKRIALPAELLRARPKRLRFLVLNTAGRIVQHARKTFLRLAALVDRIALWKRPCACCGLAHERRVSARISILFP